MKKQWGFEERNYEGKRTIQVLADSFRARLCTSLHKCQESARQINKLCRKDCRPVGTVIYGFATGTGRGQVYLYLEVRVRTVSASL